MSDGQLYAQSDALSGTFTWGYQLSLGDIHYAELHSRFGTTDILSDPSFQLQPADQWQPAALAVNWNILNQTWPQIGPFILSSALSAGISWTDGQGASTSLAAGLDLSTSYFPEFHISGQLQLTNTADADGRVQTTVSAPMTWVGFTAHF
jgi:hypothetical protein